MLLWIGSILCFIAYTMEKYKNPEALGDNVSALVFVFDQTVRGNEL